MSAWRICGTVLIRVSAAFMMQCHVAGLIACVACVTTIECESLHGCNLRGKKIYVIVYIVARMRLSW